MYRTRLPVTAATLGLLAALPAAADNNDRPWDRASLSVAAFSPDIDSRVRLDSVALLSGTDLDLERDLNLADSEDVLQVFGTLRVTDRFALEASFQDISRSAGATLAADIRYGNRVFTQSTDVVSQFDTTILAAGASFAFVQTERVELAGSVGLHLISLTSGIEAPALFLGERAEADAPLPLVGGRFALRPLPRLELSVRGEFLSVEFDDYDGSVVNLRAAVQYNVLDNLAVGAGFDHFSLDVTSANPDFPGLFEYEYQGPKLFVAATF